MAKGNVAKATKSDNKKNNYCTMQLSSKCSNRGGELPMGDFYTASNSRFYSIGRFNICKHCIKEYCYVDGELNIEKLKNILRIFDVPYLERELKSAMESKNETIGSYMKNIYLNYKDSTWMNSDCLGTNNGIDIVSGFEVDKDILRRWGLGWTFEEYQWLEDDYLEWCTNHESEKLSIQKLFQMICIKELEIRNARKNNQPTEKLEKSLRELMNDTNLTPRNMSAMSETDSTKVFGVWIKDIEKNRPAEYFDDKSLYKDFDGIKEFFDRFVLRPMKNLLVGTRDFDKEFQKIEFDDYQE